jgi:hypothetical protein
MKDPAILWYWNDWNGGTCTFTRHLKGCYIDLLAAQFNSGPLSLEEIKTVLGTDFAAWGSLTKKFKKTENGLFFNERMEAEKAKRKEFSDKQKARVLKRWNKSGSDSGNTTVLPKIENENEIRNEFKEKGVKGEKQKKPKKPKLLFEIIYPFESEQFMIAWDLWTKYKSEQHNFRFKSNISEQAALKDLSEISNHNEEEAIKIIHHAICKGWKGLFKITDYGKTTRATAKSPATTDAELTEAIANGINRANRN